jgi:hypothetical protein
MTTHTISLRVIFEPELPAILLVIGPAMLSYGLTVGGGVGIA